MMLLVIGGSGSGKSEYAENALLSLTKDSQIKRYYLAAMQVFDEESMEKVERHRQNRRGKGFHTIEQPTVIENALEKMGAGEKIIIEKEKKAALLECISNLAANEMFSEEVPGFAEQVTENVVRGIRMLKENLAHLVVVSGNVFEDGNTYDPATMEYIRAMGRINQRLSSMADRVVEVVVGIPVIIK